MKASQARSFLFSDRKILTSSVRVGVCHALRFDFPVDSSSLRHQAIAAFVQPPSGREMRVACRTAVFMLGKSDACAVRSANSSSSRSVRSCSTASSSSS
ncbi:hypothetical protein [Cupriavidus alkaliphilus]|uniref:hypothetical protein n=1 Tax=Cupriavidus alkaliphilus TaxID=942866 RepID=UPI001618BD01|nr:hypothetical protein [Cupriavidus alkaliphilus]MBB3015963.1 hypothetical protein [Cupriavidus alkaliphilus]